MGIPNIFVYTHDSVALGEDGPTHQPIEQLTNLRTTPICRPLATLRHGGIGGRPGSMPSHGPAARRRWCSHARKPSRNPGIQTPSNRCGGAGTYLAAESNGLDAVLIATGSEVGLAMTAQQRLAEKRIGVRVVSMPSTDVFLAQDSAYRDSVIPPDLRARVAVEAGHSDYWRRFVGLDGGVLGIDRFGLSAPGASGMAELGMTLDNLVAVVEQTLGR